jgi:hypothetical protein
VDFQEMETSSMAGKSRLMTEADIPSFITGLEAWLKAHSKRVVGARTLVVEARFDETAQAPDITIKSMFS